MSMYATCPACASGPSSRLIEPGLHCESCTECGASWPWQEERRYHQCTECGPICASAEALRFHMDRNHPVKLSVEDFIIEPPAPGGRAETLLALIRELMAMSDDELGVMHFVAEGIVKGVKQYGRLNIATDKRNFVQEGLAEARDMAIYLAAAMLKAGRK